VFIVKAAKIVFEAAWGTEPVPGESVLLVDKYADVGCRRCPKEGEGGSNVRSSRIKSSPR
jgi:hypothetical protein